MIDINISYIISEIIVGIIVFILTLIINYFYPIVKLIKRLWHTYIINSTANLEMNFYIESTCSFRTIRDKFQDYFMNDIKKEIKNNSNVLMLKTNEGDIIEIVNFEEGISSVKIEITKPLRYMKKSFKKFLDTLQNIKENDEITKFNDLRFSVNLPYSSEISVYRKFKQYKVESVEIIYRNDEYGCTLSLYSDEIKVSADELNKLVDILEDIIYPF